MTYIVLVRPATHSRLSLTLDVPLSLETEKVITDLYPDWVVESVGG